MRDLISELLDFRKQEQGYLKLKIEHKDIVPFIKEIYMPCVVIMVLENPRYYI